MNHPWSNQFIRTSDFSASWFTDLYRNEQKSACDVLNCAFYLYEQARESISRCTDSARKIKMRDKLNKCRYAGWGWGVEDFDDAVKYRNKHKKWDDENSKRYWHTAGKIPLYPTSGIVTASAAVHFIQAMETELTAYQALATEFVQTAYKIQRAERAALNDWDQLGNLLSKLGKHAKRIEPFLWDVPRVQRYVRGVHQFTGVVGKIHTAATRATELKTLNLTDAEAWGLSAGATFIDALPILGSLYGAAINWAIDFIPKWKQFNRAYHRKIEKMSNANDFSLVVQ